MQPSSLSVWPPLFPPLSSSGWRNALRKTGSSGCCVRSSAGLRAGRGGWEPVEEDNGKILSATLIAPTIMRSSVSRRHRVPESEEILATRLCVSACMCVCVFAMTSRTIEMMRNRSPCMCACVCVTISCVVGSRKKKESDWW